MRKCLATVRVLAASARERPGQSLVQRLEIGRVQRLDTVRVQIASVRLDGGVSRACHPHFAQSLRDGVTVQTQHEESLACRTSQEDTTIQQGVQDQHRTSKRDSVQGPARGMGWREGPARGKSELLDREPSGQSELTIMMSQSEAERDPS